MCRHVERRDFVYENCQICASKTAYCGDVLLRYSDGSVSLILFEEFASLVHQDDSPLPLGPAATEELLHCLRVDQKRSYPRSRTQLAVPATTWGMSIFLESGTIVACVAPEGCVFPPGNTLSAEGLRLSCSRSQTVVVAPLQQIFDCSRCGESRPRDSTQILHQG